MAEPKEDKPIDETVPGGRYEVGGRVVDADGNELKKAQSSEETENTKTESQADKPKTGK